MSKSVLVMDTTENCMECPFLSLINFAGKPTCIAAKKYIHSNKLKSEKPEWCPLRALPEKMAIPRGARNVDGLEYAAGYNTCINEITGGNADD